MYRVADLTAVRTKLREIRIARGWTTHYIAAAHMQGITPQQLANLEGSPAATRVTDARHIKLATALELLRVYHPELTLDALVGERTLFRLAPSDHGAKRRLGRRSAAANFAGGAA